ncbi:MAG: hypothetical protein ACKVZH_11770 [Blastocatellia bacterium]
MNSERHALLTDLLDQALDTPTGEREKFLDSACPEDYDVPRKLDN